MSSLPSDTPPRLTPGSAKPPPSLFLSGAGLGWQHWDAAGRDPDSLRVIFLGFLCGTPASLEEEGAPRVWGSFIGGLWDGVPTFRVGGGSRELVREEG